MTTKKSETEKKATSKKEISKGDIRNRAQEIYDNRIKNRIQGDAESDWVQAEKELGVKK